MEAEVSTQSMMELTAAVGAAACAAVRWKESSSTGTGDRQSGQGRSSSGQVTRWKSLKWTRYPGEGTTMEQREHCRRCWAAEAAARPAAARTAAGGCGGGGGGTVAGEEAAEEAGEAAEVMAEARPLTRLPRGAGGRAVEVREEDGMGCGGRFLATRRPPPPPAEPVFPNGVRESGGEPRKVVVPTPLPRPASVLRPLAEEEPPSPSLFLAAAAAAEAASNSATAGVAAEEEPETGTAEGGALALLPLLGAMGTAPFSRSSSLGSALQPALCALRLASSAPPVARGIFAQQTTQMWTGSVFLPPPPPALALSTLTKDSSTPSAPWPSKRWDCSSSSLR